MAKYLFQGSYTEKGLKGLLQEGGSSRVKVVEQLAASVGGKLEMFYFAYGSDDFFIVVDMPDNISVIATSMIVNASGAATARTTVLITPEEVDQASKITVDYRPPGQ
jgi:uncharacterized protein with GYD domain